MAERKQPHTRRKYYFGIFLEEGRSLPALQNVTEVIFVTDQWRRRYNEELYQL
jgi:hypothetical protein